MTVTALPPRFTIGGSECAAAAGIHPHHSRVALWAEKTGRIERETTEAMEWGTLLEPVIVEQLRALGYDPSPGHDEYRDDDRPWATGHPDGFVALAGDPALLEVKTIGQWAYRHGAAPIQYQAQCQWYMHLTHTERAVLAMLVGGQRLEVLTLERDERAVCLLLEACEDFYGYLQRDQLPPPPRYDEARESTAAALVEMFADVTPGSKIRLSGDEYRLVRELRARREQLDAVKAQVADLENTLKAVMGNAETAVSPNDDEVLRWRPSAAKRVDVKAFREQRPEMASLFETETTTRRFQVL